MNTKIVLTTLVLLTISILSVGSVSASNVGALPGNPDPNNARSQSIFIHKANFGQLINDKVKVVNNSKERKTLMVYSTDHIISSGGAFGCAQKSEAKNSVGGWINLSQSEVVLEPLTSKLVDFTISVPSNANAGENNGCIIVEEKQTVNPNTSQTGVTVAFRSAIRVLVQTPGTVVKDLSIKEFNYVSENGGTIKAILENKGNVSLDTDIEINLKNILGQVVKTYGGAYPILRNSEVELNYKLEEEETGGFYTAEIVAKYNGDAQALPGVKYNNSNVKTLTSSAITFFKLPSQKFAIYYGVGLLSLIIVIGGAVVLAKRSKASKKSTL